MRLPCSPTGKWHDFDYVAGAVVLELDACVAAPTVTSFTPASAAVGATVTITGTNFKGVSVVNFGGVPASSFTVVSSTTITAVVPATAVTGTLQVVSSFGTATSASTFKVLPVITSFTPTAGGSGTVVTITGTGFTGATAVKFYTVVATSFTVVNSTTITVTVPATAITGKLSVTTAGGTATSVGTFAVGPVITSFIPSQGAVGSVVLVQGVNLASGTTVKINGVSATTTYNSTTQLTAIVPAGATTGLVSVTNTTGTGTSATNYTVVAGTIPTITSFTPTTNVYAGVAVTITGTNFTGATLVRFNTVNATIYTVNSATTITATVPALATTGKIYVATPSGMAQSASSLTIIQPPTITSFTPTTGPVGTLVTINGTNFTNLTAVNFGGVAATSYTVVSTAKITATVPVGAVTGTIQVVNPAGTATSAGTFTVTGARAAHAETALAPLELTLYPNPAKDWVGVELHNLPTATASADILDGLGRVVRTVPVAEGYTRLDITDLKAGLYLVRVAGQLQRLVIE